MSTPEQPPLPPLPFDGENPWGSKFRTWSTALRSWINGKSDLDHKHAIADIPGLTTVLNQKADVDTLMAGINVIDKTTSDLDEITNVTIPNITGVIDETKVHVDSVLTPAVTEASNNANTAINDAADALIKAGKALDSAVLRIDSSRGLVFKNNLISTILTVTVIRGGDPITNIVDLQAAYGPGAYLEWSWKRLDDSDFGVLSSADSRISQGGFALTVSPADVDTKVVFMCTLNA